MTRVRLVRLSGVLAGLITLVVAISVALLTSSRPAVASHSQRYAVRVMPLGDSITWGQGSASDSGYRGPLWELVTEQQSRYAVQFVGSQHNGDLPQPANEGHRGWTIGRISGKVDGWLAAYRPDVVLLHLGINDLRRKIDVRHSPDRLAALIDRIYADRPGVSVVCMGLLPSTEGLRAGVVAFNKRAAALQPVERRLGRAFWYVTPPGFTKAGMADSVHPNDKGYQRMAAAFFPALNSAVAERMSRLRPSASAAAPASRVTSAT